MSLQPVGMYDHPHGIAAQIITESLLLWDVSLELSELFCSHLLDATSSYLAIWQRAEMSTSTAVAETVGAALMPPSP